ncbi:MAG: flagellar hook-basal body complex protein FliE [Succinivibrio sp.]
MSMSVSSSGAGVSILAQMQKMQMQMKTLAQAASGQVPGFEGNSPVYDPENTKVKAVDHVAPEGQVDNVGAFANMLHEAFENVNDLQNDSSSKQTRFDLGDRSVTLSDVMIASQKASLSFEATIQVRNKMIEAYKTISQMQI